MNLDDPAGFAAVDPLDALADVEETAAQWSAARLLADVHLDLDGVDAVVVLGMGGSGIAGDVVAAVAGAAGPGGPAVARIPVVTHKGYGVPGFVGPRTLVVACSYSGGTEETLSGVDAALDAGARLFAITSGGALGERAAAAGAPTVTVPGGRQPRHALGYLAVPLLVALGLDGDLDETVEVQAEIAAACGRGVPVADNAAKQLALQLASGTIPVAWGARGIGAVAAYRLKCQLNENAKLPAFVAELPELDHNEVVGFQERSPAEGLLGLVLVRDPAGEHPRIATRFRATEDLVHHRVGWTAQLHAVGESPLARLASLILAADLASVYTALELGHDPTPIPSIDRLKQALAAS